MKTYRVTLCVHSQNADDAKFAAGMALMNAWSGRERHRALLSGPMVAVLDPEKVEMIEGAPDSARFPDAAS